ncbi:hypothetical protein Nepgr_009975 [Nepenthes gracilis]|uniref:Methyltransferase type 11 domain-containing protein n=1 Tax=Nepenthes gracilis TaxID=150966 RepID=A0AAD3SBF4_NEPGR|nr:hypothetical protein Nepgr_009975 [Nepenthes gracilis]
MADLFHKQAEQYSETRPTYPPELFQFIASKTPSHDLAWDVGTGSGQAIKPLSEIYENVIGTDTSMKQLEFAPNIPNVRYHHTPPLMSIEELEETVARESTVDLVTVAQAIHWFDLPKFYEQVRWILKKPNGVIAAWCYTVPEVNDAVDSVFRPFYTIDSAPYWEKARRLVDKKYEIIEFPFEPVEGLDETGPVEFTAERELSFDGYMRYIRSSSAYNTALERGVDLLTEDVIEKFRRAWEEDGRRQKVVKFPVYLRIGKVGICH